METSTGAFYGIKEFGDGSGLGPSKLKSGSLKRVTEAYEFFAGEKEGEYYFYLPYGGGSGYFVGVPYVAKDGCGFHISDLVLDDAYVPGKRSVAVVPDRKFTKDEASELI